MSLGKDISNFLSLVIQLKNMDISNDSTLAELEGSMERYYLKKLKKELGEDVKPVNGDCCSSSDSDTVVLSVAPELVYPQVDTESQLDVSAAVAVACADAVACTEVPVQVQLEPVAEALSEASAEVPSEPSAEVPAETQPGVPAEVPVEASAETQPEVPAEVPSEAQPETPAESVQIESISE